MLWVKSFHIIMITSWMAGIFYLPRIFVHYAEGTVAGEDVRRLKVMAMKLYKFMNILAVLALAAGLTLWLYYGIGGYWLHAKLTFVGFLIIYHILCRKYTLQMQAGPLKKSGKYFRIFNEFPLLIFAAIVILVIVKPF